jgi:hypothetical protein
LSGTRAVAILVVAIAGRALAASAQRAGDEVVVADFFGDLDTRAFGPWVPLAGDLDRGIDKDRLAALAVALPCPIEGIVYGAGFERGPSLLSELGRIAPLLGNPPEVVERVKVPERFAALLDRLGLRRPAISDRPLDGREWLLKARGGAGGTHIRPADAAFAEPGYYCQERVAGRAISALFIADGHDARVVGFSEQWVAPSPTAPFRFGGCAAPASLPPRLAERLAAACGALAATVGLVGLNSLDTLVEDDKFTVLEVNPRPGATLDVLDGDAGISLWRLHLDSLAGLLPALPRSNRRAARAAAIAYAAKELFVPIGFSWPEWTADLPAPLSRLATDAPVCTALAEASTVGQARDLACRRAETILARLASSSAVFREAG